MASQTDIVNLALILLGDNTVVSINDNSKNARTIKAVYDTIREDELRARLWKFALTRANLASLNVSNIPAPYKYAYSVPSDCLRIIDAGNTRQVLGLLNYRTGLEKMYDFQGNTIYTTIPSPLAVHYVQNVQETTLFDANFVTAFAAKLAMTAAKSLTDSVQIYAKAEKDYERAIVLASRNNAIERLPEGIADDSWILARL